MRTLIFCVELVSGALTTGLSPSSGWGELDGLGVFPWGTKVVMMKSYRVMTGSGAARTTTVVTMMFTDWSIPSYTLMNCGDCGCTRVYFTANSCSEESVAVDEMNLMGSVPVCTTCIDKDLTRESVRIAQ